MELCGLQAEFEEAEKELQQRRDECAQLLLFCARCSASLSSIAVLLAVLRRCSAWLRRASCPARCAAARVEHAREHDRL